MITVHHLNNSRSQRVLWMLEELGVPYEIQRYERDPKTMLAPAILACRRSEFALHGPRSTRSTETARRGRCDSSA